MNIKKLKCLPLILTFTLKSTMEEDEKWNKTTNVMYSVQWCLVVITDWLTVEIYLFLIIWQWIFSFIRRYFPSYIMTLIRFDYQWRECYRKQELITLHGNVIGNKNWLPFTRMFPIGNKIWLPFTGMLLEHELTTLHENVIGTMNWLPLTGML